MGLEQPSRARLLVCSSQRDSVLSMQDAVFRDSGYTVVAAASKEEIQEHIENSDFDVIVLNHTLSFSERKTLARKTKLRNPATGVLVLHYSGSLGNPYVDLAVDSRAGVEPMLLALKHIEAMLHARTHYHKEFESELAAVVDANRNYTFVTDGVCRLLGYDRAMMLDLRIDDIVDGSTQVTAPLFQEFIARGEQTGRITLRHRSGKLITVDYWSRVEPDGCMIARWEPMEGATAE
ncbi:MAG TPA: PAS domain-containing protein [Candidatus Angelobacter sp.]|nr:PAS domain-containing protein [Candidatus Angelobacter sp.]